MSSSEAEELVLHSVIGFGGNVNSGLHYHPDKKNIIFPLGSTLVVRDLVQNNKTTFLHGHDGPVTCIAVSKSGKFIASGQSTHMGFKADIIVWDYEKKNILHRLSLHKVRVQTLCFSHDEKFLASVGGQDDNNVTIWDVLSGKPLCGHSCANLGHCASFFNNDSTKLVVGGKYLLRVWELDLQNRKLEYIDCQLGQLKRVVACLLLDEYDQYLYCGTTSGDLLCVQMKGPKNFKFSGPKNKIGQGIMSACFAPDGNVVVGGGDGTVAVLNRETLLKVKSTTLMGSVTSISSAGGIFYCGTGQSVMYLINYNKTLEATLLSTCHSQRINDIAYPMGTSDIIATCSINDIRLWNITKGKELVRIQVPNLECNCVCFSPSGSAVISGWSDGRIRAFGPQSGKLLFVINDAHKIIGQKRVSGTLSGVTAIAVTNDNKKIISGGSDGQVRVWKISKSCQTLIATMKEHNATVNCIALRGDDSECVTASDDGSCIVWNLQRFCRSNIMYAQTYFKQVAYLNDESQILSTGSDRHITYWDASDCNAIRELDGSEEGEIHALDIAPNDEVFASGGQEKNVVVWKYDEGEIFSIGRAHSGSVTKIKFSPDNKFITSVGEEGLICTWKLP